MKRFTTLFLAMLMALSFIGCGGGNTTSQESSSETSSNTESSSVELTAEIAVTLPTEPVSVLSAAAETYFAADIETILQTAIAEHTETNKDKAEGVPISYSISDLPNGLTVSWVRAEIFEKGETTAWKTVKFDAGETSTVIYNCKTGTTYEVEVSAKLSNATFITDRGEFSTKNTMRMMRIDGIHNVRDIGGYTTLDGKKIKQGLLYRGTELDNAAEATFSLTQAGIHEMKDVLGIKYDMDLRKQLSGSKNVLGVAYRLYDAPHYNSAFFEPGITSIKNIFTDMSNPNNYPMYVHCTYGKDRTGTVCFILGALLGMSEEDLIRDFEISGLADRISGHNREGYFMDFLANFQGGSLMSGNSLQEKANAYLLEYCGLTQAQIDSIKNIFLSE